MTRSWLYILFIIIAMISLSCNSDEVNHQISTSQGSYLDKAEYYKNNDTDTALFLARKAYALGKEQDDLSVIAESQLLAGGILYDVGMLGEAYIETNSALTNFTLINKLPKIADTHLLLSRIYQRSENYDQAFNYLQNGRNIYQELSDDQGLANVYGEAGHIFEKLQQYDSALYYQELALNYYEKTEDIEGLAKIHDNIGSIHEDLGQYDRAFYHFEAALKLNESINKEAAATINLNNLGDIFRKRGDFENALHYTSMALASARKAGQDYQIKSALRDLSKLAFELGNAKEAYEYLESSYNMTDDLFSEEIAMEIARTQSVYELKQKQEQIKFLEKSREKNRLVTLLISGAAIMIIIFSIMILLQQKSKNNKARKLLETRAELAKIELENTRLNEQYLQAELENNLLKEDRLKEELETKSKTLTKSTLHMIQKNEFLNILRNKLKNLKKKEDEQSKKSIKRLIRMIDQNINRDDEWKEFETIFQQVHSGFYNNLIKTHPDLTPTEVKLCAMIRLNLHSQEISAIMGISNDSLRTSRYRLRKRLNMTQGDNLYSHLMTIG